MENVPDLFPLAPLREGHPPRVDFALVERDVLRLFVSDLLLKDCEETPIVLIGDSNLILILPAKHYCSLSILIGRAPDRISILPTRLVGRFEIYVSACSDACL